MQLHLEKNLSLHYRQSGTGKKIIIAFHGYGNNADLFRVLTPLLEQEYTVLSFDLPFHGNSAWPEAQWLTKQQLALLVQKIEQQYQVTKVSLLGYSLGGRVCMCLLEVLPEKIERMVLVAPDGLKANAYYRFMTHTAIGRKLFRNFARHPEKYFRIVHFLRHIRVLDASRHKFVLRKTGSDEDRLLLWNVWMNTHLLIPDLKLTREHIDHYNIPVFIFMGKYDRIIPGKNAKRFRNLPQVQIVMLEKGHYIITPDMATRLTQCFF